jgi:Tol biopolymer transport system component
VLLAFLTFLTTLGVGGIAHSAVRGGESAARSRALLTYVASTGGLCAVRADGSRPQRLTPAGRRWLYGEHTWSPRGRYVAFARGMVDADESKIFVADARGKVRRRFGAGTNNGTPLWSPDGRHIAYVASWAHIYGLRVVDADGSDDHGVAMSPGFPSYGPANLTWSSDGQRLAFDDGHDIAAPPQGIFSARLDGSDRRLLVGHAIEPDYSPDGTKLAFVALENSQRRGVFVEDLAGGNRRTVSSSPGAAWPAWSPDGTRVAFIRASDVVVAMADGSAEQVVASGGASRVVWSAPLWSPEGMFVAFARGPRNVGGRPFTSSIVVARADGGGERVVVRRFAEAAVQPPAWRPAVHLPAAKRAGCSRR